MSYCYYKSNQEELLKVELTALVALPLLDLQREIKGSDGKVHSLRVDTSHLKDTGRDYT